MQKNRREFIKSLGISSVALSCFPNYVFANRQTDSKVPLVSMVTRGPAATMVDNALHSLGGIETFVKKGQTVVLKPNMSWDRRPEQAANTNPEVVKELVKLCLKAGAKQVRVFDRTCNEKRRSYKRSGIADAAKQAGAKVYFVNERRFKNVKLPNGKLIKNWEVYKDVLEADVIINVPVLKQHSTTEISIGIKNMMGFMGGDRGKIHRNFNEKIIDFVQVIQPQLTVVDATRVLMRNGPQGGSLDDVKQMNTIVASADWVAVDAVAATLMEKKGRSLGFLMEAEKRGLGIIDIEKMKIQKINLG